MNNFRIVLLVGVYLLLFFSFLGAINSIGNTEAMIGLLMILIVLIPTVVFLHKVKKYLPNEVEELKKEIEKLKNNKD